MIGSEQALTTTDAVAIALESAEQGLIAASDGQPLCSVGPGRIDERKSAEGRWAALAEAQRAVSSFPASPTEAVAAVHQRWTALARRDPEASAAWTAYWAGGLDALAGVLGGQR